MKKYIALFISAALVMTLYYGCKGKDGNEKTTEGVSATDASGFYIDDSKTPLEVGDTVE